MKKTRLISSLICIVFITTIFFGVYAANPGQDEPKNIVETDINLSDEPEVSPGTADSMQQPEISAEPEENAEEENVQSAIPSPEVNDEVDEAEVPETEIKPETEQPKEAEATPEVYINEYGAPFIETIENTEAQIVNNDGDVLSVADISEEEIQPYETNGQVMLMNDSDVELESIIDVNIDINLIDHKTIVTGNDHVLMINSDGTVSAWGSNTYGQLGNGTNTSSIEPVVVQGLSDIIEVTAGDGYSLAMDKNGEVYSWGRNSWGMLGDGSTLNTNVPNKINSLSGLNIVKVSTSGYHCLALTGNGDVYSWGTNGNGQLGLGDREYKLVPTIVQNLPSSIDIAAAGFSSYAVDMTGSVWSWGNNNSCKLGFTYSGDILSPNKTVIKDIESISTGYDHCLAIGEDGNIYSWGDNGFGQLGVTGITTYTPQKQDIGLSNVKNSFSKCHHSVAVTSDGKTYAWGRNDYGQLGIGTISDKVFEPTLVIENSFETVAMDIYSTYAVSSDGNLYKWGYMPNTDMSKYINGGSCVPLDIPTETRFVQVEAKRNSVVALDVNGDVYTWGDGAYDDLGHGNKDNVYYPKKVEGLPKIKQVAKGENHTLAVDVDGNVWGWGNNSSKEIDYNYSGHIITPIKLTEINSVKSVSAGQGFSAAIKNDSSLWTWGHDYSGQLGIGGPKVNNVNKISGIDCFHSIVDCGESYLLTQYLYSNYDVTYDPYLHHCTMACGANNRGQLGKGDLVNSSVLSKVQNLEGYEVKGLSAGREHALALYSDGDVYSWGSNTIGQLGLGDKVDRMLPVKIQGVSNIKYIKAAYAHSMAITNSGNLYAWGEGRDGQLGIGVKETKRLPVLVQGIKNVNSVTGGSAFSIALDNDGRLWSFGNNKYGQLGVISCVPITLNKINYIVDKSSVYITITQNKVRFEAKVNSLIEPSDEVKLNIIDNNKVLKTDTVVVNKNGEINTDIAYSLSGGKYKIILFYNNSIYQTIEILVNKINIDCLFDQYLSVPMAVKSIDTFSNRKFFLTYDKDYLEIMTSNEFCDNFINIKDNTNGKVSFTCNRSINQNVIWSGVINTIRFKVKKTGNISLLCYTY